MDDSQTSLDGAACQGQIEKDFRWNFSVNVLEGAFFWFGTSFAASATILPLYVSHLTDSRVLIGLISAISGAGWYLPQLFTANYVARLPVKKRMVIRVGLFSERLPLLVMALSVFLFAARSPRVALVLFFSTLAWHAMGAGIIAIAWQDMIAKVIPVNYRGRLLGLANSAGSAAGILGAALAAGILARFPFPTNFGVCISLTFLFVMASWFSLALTREPPSSPQRTSVSLSSYLRGLPGVLRQDRNFAAYMLSRTVAVFAKMGIGFVTVYAVQRWRLADSQAGFYTIMLLAGGTIANLVGGLAADRLGHKLVLEVGLILLAICMLLAVIAPSPVWMYPVFAGIGGLVALDILSGISLPMEFANPEQRPTYIGLANTIPGLFAAVSPMIGGWLAARTSYTTLFLVSALLSAAAWVVLRWFVLEPRWR